jgi:hypothetical protein
MAKQLASSCATRLVEPLGICFAAALLTPFMSSLFDKKLYVAACSLMYRISNTSNATPVPVLAPSTLDSPLIAVSLCRRRINQSEDVILYKVGPRFR